MSSHAKNSPGPWRYQKDDIEEAGFTIHSDDGLFVGQVEADPQGPRSEGWMPEAEGKANAALIASAPEMLEMLYALIPCAEESDEFNKPTHKAGPKVRALIAKAEGRS